MDLIERYLEAVRVFLPRANQDDIIAELAENIHSEVEDLEAACGRPLTEAELADLLKRLGPPLMVAGGFKQPQARYLVGPILFPVYRTVMLVLLCVFVVPAAISAIGLLVTGAPLEQIGRAVKVTLAVALPMFGWVTFVFAVIDWCVTRFRVIERWTAQWSPRNLPPVVKSGQPVRRTPSMLRIVAVVVFVLWWLAAPRFPQLAFGAAYGMLRFGESWAEFHNLVTALALLALLQHCAWFSRPHRSGIPAFTSGAAALMLCLTLRCYPYVVPGPSLPGSQPARLAETINVTAFCTVLFVALPWVSTVCIASAWQSLRPRTCDIAATGRSQ